MRLNYLLKQFRQKRQISQKDLSSLLEITKLIIKTFNEILHFVSNKTEKVKNEAKKLFNKLMNLLKKAKEELFNTEENYDANGSLI